MANTYRVLDKVHLQDEEEFVDILEDKRHCSDLRFAFRTFSPPPYKGAPACSSAELNQAVLESQYLRYVINEVALEMGSSVEEVRDEACGIMREMSQNLQLRFIRLMGFVVRKVFKRIFSAIYVNMERLQALQQATQECPVILMPNHRSYIDFLVVSYILFNYDIPVPVIAAGIPLAGMKIVGEMLRRSGAFFIRRAIGSDKLYWAVLSEYVRTIVRKGFAPLEFFVEGLRSRTLKSLPPKLGMMNMILEPFFKGEVYDVTLLPISISYERVLEESLLAHELLGFPKPRESTAGLLKASRVLQENYGCMHVNFGRPLSARRLCEGKINRCQYNLTPRDLPQKPNAEAQACGSWLAHMIVRLQEEGALTSPWSLMACVLLQVPTAALTEEGLLFHQLTERTLWLRKLALDFRAHLNWPEKVPDSDVMSSTVALHRSVVYRKAGRVYLTRNDELEQKHSIEEDMMRTAAALLMLASYRNQCLHVFVRPALLALAMSVTKSTRKDELLTCFCFLQEVFSNEFVFIPGQSSQDFEEACSLLHKCKAVHVGQWEVTDSDTEPEVLSFLQELLKPFIESYQLMFRFLCEERDCVFREKDFLSGVRTLATKLIVSGELHTYEALSSDMQKNVLSSLRRLGAITKITTSQNNEYKVNKSAVRRTGDMLAGRIPPQIVQAAPDARL
ncbi:dihydroxyacetone phosphate acyltransferase isoform X2 [Poecilia formosa]|uniref:dihydroxyacetone phosphate acyltransferase isoform X1 n=1 Tax=Poecilia formosa TaxID=48698 RepID=UPI000443AD3A|nr:PREDICTED: dihydroxyacetone phosphate acyltransferase-like isoform X1 [Poecilia formosa]XP_016531350.1 PREDICTED: dihydroxyacetone phosphate acyltransferase-like isoform X2 [Poecilia formosa]